MRLQFNRYHLLSLGGLALAVGLWFLSDYWTEYTIAHSSNPRIDFNFAAAFLSLLAIGLGLASFAVFVGAFFKPNIR